MSLIRKQRELEGASDAYLQQLLQQGSPEYPGWLVATVANGRAFDRQLKANAMAMARAEEPTITDQVATKLDEAGVPSVDPNQMGDPRLATGIASGVAVAGGGMIPEYQNGGLMGDDDDDPSLEDIRRSLLTGVPVGGTGLSTGLREGYVPQEYLRSDYDYGQQQADIEEARRITKEIERLYQLAKREGRDPTQEEIQAVREGGRASITDISTQVGSAISAPSRERGIVQALTTGISDEAQTELEEGLKELGISGSAPFSAEIVNEEVLENPSMTSEGMQDVMRGRRDIVTGEEITEDDIPSAQSYADQLIAEMRAQREQNATTMANLLSQGFGFIDNYEAARQPDADDQAIYRRQRRDLSLALSQARKVADERGANAEERQEIYDNLKADLEAQADQRAATRARIQEVRGIKARGVGLGDLGTSRGRERMSQFTEDIFEEDIAAEDREREAILGDSARLLSDLTSLQNYEEATGTSLDEAVLAESRGQTTLLGNLLDTDESLEADVLNRRLSLIERALSPAASLEAANERAAAAGAAARNAQTVSEFERRFFDPSKHVETLQFFDNWIQNVEEDPDLTDDPEERERLIDDIRRVKTVYFNRGGQDFMTGLGMTVAGIPELTSQRVTTPTGFTNRMLRDAQQRYSDG